MIDEETRAWAQPWKKTKLAESPAELQALLNRGCTAKDHSRCSDKKHAPDCICDDCRPDLYRARANGDGKEFVG